MRSRQVKVKAFAKINLGLRVLYKRADGYHELRTVFQTISLADDLGITWMPGAEAAIQIEGTPHIPDNLVEKAARLVLQMSGATGSAHFQLKKNIPAGAGLGGGSSDAAAVLLALPALTGRPIPMAGLCEAAAKLGSDVPFFLYGGTALGLGRGEELYPLPERTGGNGLLVAPEIHSSTADAYRDLSVNLTSNSLQNKLVCFQQEVWQRAVPVEGNDFESVVFARHPELRRIKDRLLALGASSAAMSGSGSSVFGFFDSPEDVERARDALRNSFAVPCSFHEFSLIDRARYQTEWNHALQNHLQGNEWPPQSLYAQ